MLFRCYNECFKATSIIQTVLVSNPIFEHQHPSGCKSSNLAATHWMCYVLCHTVLSQAPDPWYKIMDVVILLELHFRPEEPDADTPGWWRSVGPSGSRWSCSRWRPRPRRSGRRRNAAPAFSRTWFLQQRVTFSTGKKTFITSSWRDRLEEGGVAGRTRGRGGPESRWAGENFPYIDMTWFEPVSLLQHC